MSVSKDQVLAIAALCRLDLSVTSTHAGNEGPEERVNRIAAQMDTIVGYMDILNSVDTDAVAPLYSPMLHAAPPRPDHAEKRRTADDMLANAPGRRQNFFVVPPVI